MIKKELKRKSPLQITMGSILQGGLDWNILTVIFPTLASRPIFLISSYLVQTYNKKI